MRGRMRAIVVGLLAALTLAALAVAAVPAAVGQDEVLIYPFDWIEPHEYTIYPGQVAVIYHGWGAANTGLAGAFWRHLEQEFVLTRDDGWTMTIGTDEARESVGPIVLAPELDDQCRGRNAVKSYMSYRLADLEPGEYTLESRGWLPHRFTDGCDSDGDGKVDHQEGEVFSSVKTITVLGEPAD